LGRGGDFQIRYNVLTEQLIAQLRQGEEAVRASAQRMATAGAPTANVALTKDQIASERALSQVKRDKIAQGKLEIAQKRENRLAQAQANRETDRAAGSLKKQAAAGTESSKVIRHLTLALRRMIIWWATAAVLLGTQRLAKEIVNVAAAFQLVVKELTVLGNEGEQAYRRLAASAIDTASQTGRSFEEAADALKGWVRQGYSAIEAADLMRTTLIGLNLTQLSSTELVRTMTAVMRAFNIPATESIGVIDKLIGVSRRYAIETGQLATGIRRFAASASTANVTLDQQIGIMTAMIVRTQQSAQMVGRAGRTIFTRMRRNAIEALETIAKVQVFTDASRQSYRSLWEVLTDLAGTWKNLTEAEREEIAFQSAGLRQREFFLALMSDFKVAQEANIESLGSVGLAYKSNALLVNTLSKSITGLKTAWTGLLSQQTGILGFVSGLVNGLRTLLEVSVRIPEALLAIGAVLPGLIALGAALFTAWSPTLLLNLIAITGAIAGLTWALGKLRGADTGSIIQESKELADTMILEATNARKLAGEFISLYDAQTDSIDNTDLLIQTREKIERLYPGLIEGEENLKGVYDTLQDSLVDMTRKTIELTDARKEYQRVEMEIKAGKALDTILETRSKPPKGMENILMEDPEDIGASLTEIKQHLGAVQAAFRSYASDDIAYLTIMRRLMFILADTTGMRQEANEDLLKTYAKQVDMIKAMRSVGVRGEGGLMQYTISDERLLARLLVSRKKDRDAVGEQIDYYFALYKATVQLRDAQEQLDALDAKKDTDFGDDIKGKIAEVKPDPAYKQDLRARLDVLGAQMERKAALNDLTAKSSDLLNEEAGQTERVKQAQLALLDARIASTTNEAELVILVAERARIQAGSVRDLQVQETSLSNLVQLQEEYRSAVSKAAREKAISQLNEQSFSKQLKEAEIAYANAKTDSEREAAAEAIKGTLGRVAAFAFLRQKAQESFNLAASAAKSLSADAPLTDVLNSKIALLGTYDTLIKAESDFDKAVAESAERSLESTKELQRARDEAKQKTEERVQRQTEITGLATKASALNAVAMQTEIEYLREQAKATDWLREAKEQLIAVDADTIPELGEDIKRTAGEFQPDPAIQQKILGGLDSREKRLRAEASINSARSEGLDLTASQLELNQRIRQDAIAGLEAQIASTDDMVLRTHLMYELARILATGTSEMQEQSQVISEQIRLQGDLQSVSAGTTADPAFRQNLLEALDLEAEKIKLKETGNRLESAGKDSGTKAVELKRKILMLERAYIIDQLAIITNEAQRLVLYEALEARGIVSTREIKLQTQEIKNQLRLLDEAESKKVKDARAKDKADREAASMGKKLSDAELAYTKAQTDAARDAAVEDIKNTRGRVAASLFLEGKAKEALAAVEAEAERLGDTAPVEKRIAVKKKLVDALQAQLKATADVNQAVREDARRNAERDSQLLSMKQREAVQLTDLQKGPVPAARLAVEYAKENLAATKNITHEDERQQAIRDRGLALERARVSLRHEEAQQLQELSKADADIAKVRQDNDLEIIGILDGEFARLITIRDLQQEIVNAAEKDTSAEGKLKLKEETIKLLKAEGAIEAFNTLRDKTHGEKMKDLEVERLGIINANAIAEETQRHGKIAGLKLELQLIDEALVEAEEMTKEKEKQILIQELLNAREEITGEITRANLDVQQRAMLQFIQLAGQQATAAVQGTFSGGSLVQGLSGLVASMLSASNPIIAGVVTAAGSVLGALFGDPAEDLSDSLERNTTAIDRNTQTLQDVFAQRIGVPTGFSLPASIVMQGALPGGGGAQTIVQQNQYDITIPVDGRGQDAEQIAITVQKRLDKQFSINSRRGFGTNVYALG